MNAEAFWNVIGEYNRYTWVIQLGLLAFVLLAAALSYTQKVKWAAKLALGIANLFISIAFFAMYGTEPIQRYFALPLYLMCGVLFLYECLHNKNDALEKPNAFQALLLLLYLCYPVISMLLGNGFPQTVTYIMPCPVVSLSIAVYSGYQSKNKLLLGLLTIWGLTGIKSLIFSAYEDIILLICGAYGVVLFTSETRCSKREAVKENSEQIAYVQVWDDICYLLNASGEYVRALCDKENPRFFLCERRYPRDLDNPGKLEAFDELVTLTACIETMDYETALAYPLEKDRQILCEYCFLDGKGELDDPEITHRNIEGFTFCGFEIADKWGISALTNCAFAYDRAFTKNDLNKWGLIDNYQKARTVLNKMYEEYGDDPDAKDLFLFAVWRRVSENLR